MGSGQAKPVEVVQKDSAGVAAKRLYEPDTQLRPALLAGKRGTAGATDGAGPSGEAQFAFPSGVCVGNGNVWGAKAATAFPVMNAPVLLVADLQNARVRKLDRNGTVATVAGAPAPAAAASTEPQPAGGPAAQTQSQSQTQSPPSGSSSGGRSVVDGPATSATFAQPVSVAVDSAANVYVCDTGAHCIRKITPAGEVSTFVGRGAIESPLSPLSPLPPAAADDEKKGGAVVALPAAPKAKDLSGTAATLWFPTAVCIDSDDNLYIADAGHFLVRKVATRPPLAAAAAGAVVNTNGSGAGAGAGAAVGAVRTLCGNGEQGYRDGSPEDAMFGRLGGIAVDSKFNVYVTDYQHHTVRKIAPDGFTATLCGRRNVAGASDGAGFAAGSSAEATFAGPLGLCVDGNDNLFVADSLNGVIRKVLTASSTADVRTVHTSPVPGAAPGAAGAATKTFEQPCGVCCYAGQLYVTDPTAHALYKIDFDTTASGGPDGAERACFRRVCT